MTFGGAEDVFCVAITSGLSGSYNAACIAKEMYETEHPGRRVFVIDSLSAGPELTLLVEKLEELIVAGKSFEEICDYMPKDTENKELLEEIERVKMQMENAHYNFQNAMDPDLIDCYIFESNAAWKRYRFLLKEAKKGL